MRERDQGAHFYRRDFQVHTPRDAQWKGKRPQTAAEREVYAESFVAKCREIGLHAVAITDHHDLALAPIIRGAARAETDSDGRALPEKEQLVVFPGVELTLAVPCQALLILDASLPDDRLSGVLQALDCEAHDATADRLPDVKNLEHITSLPDLYDILDRREWLRDHYIVLPNVTDGGHQTMMRSGMAAKYKEMPCVGGYLDGSIDKIRTGNAEKFAGTDASWDNKRIAVFQTSDSRSETLKELGRHSTWVKWARPTAEALRQACLGQESRVAQSAPQIPTVFISSLHVSNSKFLGPVDMTFNPQYNAIIGGRGTGKSTILDYLRWGLCDQAAHPSDEELANPAVRREKLIEDTLSPVDGQVEIHFTINDVPHVVRRDASNSEILLKVGDDEFTKVREEHVRSRLTLHAYSQKQLSGVSLRVDELTRFVTAPIQRALDIVDHQTAEFAGKLRENYAKVQRARYLDDAVERQRLAETSLGNQAANLRDALPDLSDEDRRVLDSKPEHDEMREVLKTQPHDIRDLLSKGEEFITQIETSRDSMYMQETSQTELSNLMRQLCSNRAQRLTALHSAVAKALGELNDSMQAGADVVLAERAIDTLSTFDEHYREVKARSTAHQAKLDELAVEEQRAEATRLLSRHLRERQSLGHPIDVHARLRAEMIEQFRERTRLILEESTRMAELSGGLIRTSIKQSHGLGPSSRSSGDLSKVPVFGVGKSNNCLAHLPTNQIHSPPGRMSFMNLRP
jgi:type III restriction enzyme